MTEQENLKKKMNVNTQKKKNCTNQSKVRFLNIIGPLKKYPVYTKVSCIQKSILYAQKSTVHCFC